MKAIRYSIDSSLMFALPVPFNANMVCYSMRVYFNTEAERDSFINLFPKSLRVKPGYMYTKTSGEYSAGINVSGINKATGTVNEIGIRRLNRFYAGIKQAFNL